MYRAMKLDRYSRFPQISASVAATDGTEDRQMQEEALWTKRMRNLLENEDYENEV